jgi:hypothetical protein
MMARRLVLGGMTGAAVALLGGCSILFPAKYRFRMTVEVATPQGLRTGSSVMEITAYESMSLTSEEHSGGGAFRGQAVVVDLPSGPIFALMTTVDAGQPMYVEVTHALAPDARLNPTSDYVAAVSKLGGWSVRATADLPRDRWPMMVRFRDLNDSKSVEPVDPEAVGVKRIVVETTRDDITTGIEKRFPSWFTDLTRRRANLSGKSMAVISSNELADTMSPGSFSTEIK